MVVFGFYLCMSLQRSILIILSYSRNINLREGDKTGSRINVIIGSSVGAAVLLIITIFSCLFMRKGKKRYSKQGMSLVQSSS